MDPHHRLYRKAKGWSEKELQHAQHILEQKTSHDIVISKILFWSSLVVIIFANIVVMAALMPFLSIFPTWVFYTLIIIIALTTGVAYNFLINDILHLETHHHIIGAIMVPALAISNVGILVIASNQLIHEHTFNPWISGSVYAIVFILPYLVHRLHKVHHAKRRAVIR